MKDLSWFMIIALLSCNSLENNRHAKLTPAKHLQVDSVLRPDTLLRKGTVFVKQMNFFDSLRLGIILSTKQVQKHFDIEHGYLQDGGTFRGEEVRVFRDSLRLVLLNYDDRANCSYKFLVLATIKNEQGFDSKLVDMRCDSDGDVPRTLINYTFLNNSTFVVYERTLHDESDTVGVVTEKTIWKVGVRKFIKVK